MPMYDLRCKVCNARETVFRRMSEYNNLPTCNCGGGFERIVSAPMIRAAFESYISPATGKLIDSPGKRNEDLKRSGAIIHERGIEKDIARNKEASLARSFAPIEKAIDSTVTQLVAAGKLES